MGKIVLAASLAVLLAGTSAVAQETKKGMEMKHDMKHGEMHEKMQEKMKDRMKDKMKGKHEAKKGEPAKKDEHKH